MNLNEIVKWFADRGINRDRSTYSKALKAVGVMPKSGKVTAVDCEKAAKMRGWKISIHKFSDYDEQLHNLSEFHASEVNSPTSSPYYQLYDCYDKEVVDRFGDLPFGTVVKIFKRYGMTVNFNV